MNKTKANSKKEPATSIDEIKEMLQTIIKNQDQILKQTDPHRSVKIPLTSLLLTKLPNLHLND